MIYTKVSTVQGYVIEIPLDEGIFTNCNQCCKEIELNGEIMKHILEEGDLATTKIICKDCAAEKIKEVNSKRINVTVSFPNMEKSEF